jgi:hypothetical protein
VVDLLPGRLRGGGWQGHWETREEAIRAAPEELGVGPGDRFWVGRAVQPSLPGLDAEEIIEELDRKADEDFGKPDGADGWPQATDEQVKELDGHLNAALDAWLARHDLKPTWFGIEDDEKVAVPAPEEAPIGARCDACRGTGWQAAGEPERVTVRCSGCRGTGRRPVEASHG